MQTKIFIALGMTAAILAGSGSVQAADGDAVTTATRTQEQTRLQTPDTGMRTELDQRNRIWSMQGATDGSYAGDAERNKVQTRTQEQVRTSTGSRYGQGYESRQGGGGFGGGPGGSGRSSGAGGSGGGRR